MTASPNQPAKPLFAELIADEMRQVDDVIRTSLHSEVVLVRQVAQVSVAQAVVAALAIVVLLAHAAVVTVVLVAPVAKVAQAPMVQQVLQPRL